MEIFRSDQRGYTENYWLNSRHSFSFGNYYDPRRNGFGKLRVFNDDIIQPGEGFDAHEHDNMEIITIVLDGSLKHVDSTGHSSVLKEGMVQVMSAGTGIEHSEHNASAAKPARFLQVWIYPDRPNIKPSYDQKAFKIESKPVTVVSGLNEPGCLPISQKARISLLNAKKGVMVKYAPKIKASGLFLFVAKGSAAVKEEKLGKGDSVQMQLKSPLEISAGKGSYIVLIETV